MQCISQEADAKLKQTAVVRLNESQNIKKTMPLAANLHRLKSLHFLATI